MTSKQLINQKSIIIVNYQFTDFSSFKARPCIVTSNDEYNKNSEDILICPISSSIMSSEWTISINNDNLDEGVLNTIPCYIKCDHLTLISKEIILQKIGCLNNKTFKELITKIYKLL